MVVWTPLFHVEVAFQVNWAASGAPLSASRASSSAWTLTPLMTEVVNGVNVQALLDAREALKGAPEAAQFTWKATSTWNNGVHTTIKLHNYFGLGQEQSHKVESVFEADHPEVFAAEDNGITPIEYLLVGLASCLSASVASVAENRGIKLKSAEATLDGNHDIRGNLRADSHVRNDLIGIQLTVHIV